MANVTFISNDFSARQLEGVYIKERNPPATLQGVVLNGVGIGGKTIRGPVGKAVKVDSEQRFVDVFGGRDDLNSGALVNEVWKALLNKQFGPVYVVRAYASAAAAASYDFDDGATVPTDVITIAASSVGAWGNSITVSVKTATDGNANHFNLEVTYGGKTVKYENLDTSSTNNNLSTVIGDDDANIVTVTKLAAGRPANVTDQSLTDVAGSDGSLADADFTGTGKVIDILNTQSGVAIAMLAGWSTTAAKAAIKTAAALVNDRIWLICPDAETTTTASAITEAATFGSDRIVYCFNHAKTLDPDASVNIWTEPHAWMASILSQTNSEIDPGDIDNKKFTAGIAELYNTSLSRQNLIDLRAAGASALRERNPGQFMFKSAVTTDLTPGKTRITRRRMTDEIQLNLGEALENYEAKPGTAANVRAATAAQEAVLDALAPRLIDQNAAGEYQYEVDPDVLNTTADLALGIRKWLVRVNLIDHMLSIVIETEIGEAVEITQTA